MTSLINRLREYSIPVLSIMIILFFIPGAQAWSNGGYSSDPQNPDYGTHDWIADQALSIQTKDVTFLTSTYHSKFLLGTEYPDNPYYIGDSTTHHIYYYSSGTLQDDASADRAAALYQTSLEYLKANNKEGASYYIGAMTHYIADIGVFGHTMGSGTDWGTENHHSDFENAIESMIHSLDLPSGAVLGNKTAYNAAVNLAKDVTFGNGDIKTNVWMDANYNWADASFEASAIASLYASATSVAAVINHLLIEATPAIPPSPPPSQSSVPQAPISLNAALNGSNVMLTWSPPQSNGGSAIEHYRIYRKTNTSQTSLMASVDDSARSWKDESVKEGKTYYYTIRAENSVGLSNASEEVSVTIPMEINSNDSALIPAILFSSALIAIGSGGAFILIRKNRKKV